MLTEEDKLTAHPRFHKWKDVSQPEMMRFLSLILNMGIIDMPDIESYRKTSCVCCVPFFSQVLPRDRFMVIFWLLHVGTP